METVHSKDWGPTSNVKGESQLNASVGSSLIPDFGTQYPVSCLNFLPPHLPTMMV